MALAGHVPCNVSGVYNQSGFTDSIYKPEPAGLDHILSAVGRFVSDTSECVMDLASIKVQHSGIEKTITLNPTVMSLYRLLRRMVGRKDGVTIRIVAHSQGNLIASNALYLYRRAVERGEFVPHHVHVYAIASPAPDWPASKFIHVKSFMHNLDPIPSVFNPIERFRPRTEVIKNTKRHEFKGYVDEPAFLKALRRDLGITDEIRRRFEASA
jgi:hypothetical protein